MSDMSINAVSSGASASVRSQAQTASAAAAAVSVVASQGASIDYSNRVDNLKGIVDPNSGVFVIQQREGSTGAVKNEYPSKQVVAAYKRNEAALAAPKQSSVPVQSGSGEGVSNAVEGAPVAASSVGNTTAPAVSSAPAPVSTGPTSVEA